MSEQPDDLQHRLVLSVREVGVLLGVGESKARQIIYDYRLPILRLTRDIKVPRKAVEDLIEEQTREAEERRDARPTDATIFGKDRMRTRSSRR